jgi:hypothetical protein
MNKDPRDIESKPEPGETLVGDEEFRDLVRLRARALLDLTDYLSLNHPSRVIFARTLLGNLMFQSAQLVELLDEYGARQNSFWCRFRALASSTRLFARVSYALTHLRHALPGYRLEPVDGDLAGATLGQLFFVNGVLEDVAESLLKEAKQVGVLGEVQPPSSIDFSEHLPRGRLAYDRDQRYVDSAAAIVTQLATDFLNLAAEAELLHTSAKVAPENYATCIPDPISEERLRRLTFRFHNLQSLYDTHVAGTMVETLDTDLPILRGLATTIFHLLEIATDLVHYYERHLSPHTGDSVFRLRPVVGEDDMLESLFGYAIYYASAHLSGGERLCQGMLKRYAELGRIEVPVPNYRGFHVRPSNLVARIARHYGSELLMDLDGETYDASSPLELFRANEKINARKRRWLALEIANLPRLRHRIETDETGSVVFEVVRRLAEQGKVVLYQQPLQLSGECESRNASVLAFILTEIGQLQATGQLDIRTDLTVAFMGDKRVLADVDLLARHGYGEDRFGNNTVLPKALAYLRA